VTNGVEGPGRGLINSVPNPPCDNGRVMDGVGNVRRNIVLKYLVLLLALTAP